MQMVVASSDVDGKYEAHAKGIAAILKAEPTTLDLLLAARSFQASSLKKSDKFEKPEFWIHRDPSRPGSGLFLNPSSDLASPSLDDLMLAFFPIWKRATDLKTNPAVTLDEINDAKSEAVRLKKAFEHWQDVQTKSFRPWTIGHVDQERPGPKFSVGRWPTKVDIYFDYYIASGWNTSRTARLLLIQILNDLEMLTNSGSQDGSDFSNVLPIVDEIISSIPFHLAEDVQVFMQDVKSGSQGSILNPGRAAGGLLLLHPLHVASTLLFVPLEIREYLKDCLEWISLNMGIGLASVLSKVRSAVT